MCKSLLPIEVKVNFTIGDIRTRSNPTNNKIVKFTKESFFFTILGFNQSQSGALGDMKNSFKKDQVQMKAKNRLLIRELIKFFQNVIVLMDLLLMVSECLLCIFAPLVNHQDVKYTKHLKTNFL